MFSRAQTVCVHSPILECPLRLVTRSSWEGTRDKPGIYFFWGGGGRGGGVGDFANKYPAGTYA